ENIERRLAPDAWSRTLNYKIATIHLRASRFREFLERMLPVVDSMDPADRAFLREGKNLLGSTLYATVIALTRVGQRELPLRYHQVLIEESADWDYPCAEWSRRLIEGGY